MAPETLRHAMSHFASGVTVVTALVDGVAHAMTATAFSSVSLDPPLGLVCVGKASRFHAAAGSTDHWAVSILAADQEPLARHFSHSGRDLLTQFDDVPHTAAPFSGAPLIVGATMWLECLTYARHDAGDHTIVVGEVIWVGDPQVATAPLTYYRGSYRKL